MDDADEVRTLRERIQAIEAIVGRLEEEAAEGQGALIVQPTASGAGGKVFAAQVVAPRFDEREGATITWEDPAGRVYAGALATAPAMATRYLVDQVGDRWVLP